MYFERKQGTTHGKSSQILNTIYKLTLIIKVAWLLSVSKEKVNVWRKCYD